MSILDPSNFIINVIYNLLSPFDAFHKGSAGSYTMPNDFPGNSMAERIICFREDSVNELLFYVRRSDLPVSGLSEFFQTINC